MRLARQVRTAVKFFAVVARALFDRNQGTRWLQRWTREGLRALRIDVEAFGPTPAQGVLVSNHLSYIDILVFSAITPCTFVSKSEVGSWPVIGRLTMRAGTILVRRDTKSHVGEVNGLIGERLRRGELVVFFPEGTSTDGSKVLPFHSSLFEAAVGNGLLIQAAQISYVAEDGNAGTDVCYWGDMTLATHLWKLFGLKRVHARVRFGPPAKYADRKTAAIETRQSVLALTGSD